MATTLPSWGAGTALLPRPPSPRVWNAPRRYGPLGAGWLSGSMRLHAAVLLIALLVAWPLPQALAQTGTNTTGAPATNATTSSSNSTAAPSTSTSPTSSGGASSLPAKWTFLIYMLADNNLECFGLLDMLEMMQGMAVEPSDCRTTTCGASCPPGYVVTGRTSCGGGQVVSRCCAEWAYPDVLVLADRGVASCSSSLPTAPTFNGLDLSLLQATWTTAKELLVLPGGALQQERDYGEIDMAAPEQLSAFLTRAYTRFGSVSASGAARKYALVLWDHGNGWKGYGVDDTCASGAASSPSGCDQFTIPTLVAGLSQGLSGSGAARRLDVIGFDACLMSMYEVGSALAPYARSLLASELLEPGHGWDYTALGNMTRAASAAAAAGSSSLASVAPVSAAAAGGTLAEEAAVGGIWIAKYKGQAVAYGTTGITLALTDLGGLSTTLVPAVAALSDSLITALSGSNGTAVASSVLRRRTVMAQMGTGEQESTVDLGNALTELAAASGALGSGASTALAAARSAYAAALLAFGRDDELAKGTGLAIYFPLQASKMDADYGRMTGASGLLAPAAGRWAAFLTKLYEAASGSAGSGGSGGAADAAFGFVPSAASVPYLHVASDSYVLQATLNSPLALSASLYYGFIDATAKFYVLAGSQSALIDGTRVTGSWRRLIWGITQRLSSPSSTSSNGTGSSTAATAAAAAEAAYTPSRTALMYASEDWIIAADGSTAMSVSLTANVKYAPTCSSPRTRMGSAILKYTYSFVSRRASLQLFAQQASGAFGEVAAAAGGVIVPLMYKLPRDFSGSQNPTYEYSGCLKWGYNGTVRVTAVGVTLAADSLGVDLDEELLLFLQARDVSLTKSAYLVGTFDVAATAHTTVGGCTCLMSWRAADGAPLNNGCANPNNDTAGAWCPIQPGSCTQPGKARGDVNSTSSPWDYCSRTRTLSGCACADVYPVDPARNGSTLMYGKCVRNDARALSRGAWCTVNPATCPSAYRAHGSNDTSYDYCETRTVEGCYCANTWTYNGVTYNGTCATGFPGPDTPPEGLYNTTRWCVVNPGCPTRNQVAGQHIGLCGLAVPPTAGASNTPCVLPATLSGGVAVADCVPWRNGPNAADRADGISPVCPTNAAATTFATCNTRTCTPLDLTACPSGLPKDTNLFQLSPWTGVPCLEQLCAAAVRTGDAGACAADATRVAASLAQLNASVEVAEQLQSKYGIGSVPQLCSLSAGDDCLVQLLLPACPALRLNSSAAANAYETARLDPAAALSDVCSLDCLKALCRAGGSACARATLTDSLRLSLLEAMDTRCAASGSPYAASFAKPAAFLCTELLAPAPTCARSTTLTGPSGNVALTPVPGSTSYAPLTNCTWVIQPAGMSYIKLSFASYASESLYDTLLVEDGDGVVAVLSGGLYGGSTAALAAPLYTDTGLFRLTFTSDSSIGGSGFAASYTASATRSVALPSCSERQKLLMINLRTAAYANEYSWVLVGYRVVVPSGSSSSGVTGSSNSTSSGSAASTGGATQQVMLAAGGTLPAPVYSFFSSSDPSLTITDTLYKDNRTYTSYVCVPAGFSMLYLYDSYGDGWPGGGLITVSYLRSAASSYRLANATVRGYNASLALNIFSSMPNTPEEYAAALARNKAGGGFSVRATLRLQGEVSGTNTLSQTKQLILRGAVASLLAVDVTTTGVSAPVANTNSGSAASGRRRQLLSWLLGSALGRLGHSSGSTGHADASSDSSSSSDGLELAAGTILEVSDLSGGGPGPQVDYQRNAMNTAPATGTADPEPEWSRTQSMPAVDDATAAVAAAAAGAAADAGELAGGEALVHEPGVVEALLASARALGLKPAEAEASPATGESIEAEAGAEAAARRQALTALDQLFWQPRVAEPALADLVSTQQPQLVVGGSSSGGSSSSGSSSSSSQAQQDLGSVLHQHGGSSTASAKQQAPAGAGVETSYAIADGSTAEAIDREDADSNSGASSKTVLLNGVVLGADGVPIFSRVGAVAASGTGSSSGSSSSSSSSGSSLAGRTLIARAVAPLADRERPPRQVTITHAGSAEVAQHVAPPAHAVDTSSPGSALGSLEEELDAMRRAAARASAVAAGQTPGRTGGRSVVPGLMGRGMAAALRQHAAELVALAAQLPTPAATHVADAAGVQVAPAPAGGGGGADTGSSASEVGEEEAEDEEDYYEDDGDEAAATGAAGALAQTAVTATAPSAAAAGAVTAHAFAVAGASVPRGDKRIAATQDLPMGTVTEVPQEHGQTEATAQPQSQSQAVGLGLAQLDNAQQQQQQRQRRQLQQATASVDVVLVLVGYGSREDAAAASAQLTSAVRGGDLQKALGDAGWTAAAPALVGSSEVVDSKGATSVLGGGGSSWTNLALIIGAAAGGGLAAVLVCGLLVCLFRRRRRGSGETSSKVAPGEYKDEDAVAAAKLYDSQQLPMQPMQPMQSPMQSTRPSLIAGPPPTAMGASGRTRSAAMLMSQQQQAALAAAAMAAEQQQVAAMAAMEQQHRQSQAAAAAHMAAEHNMRSSMALAPRMASVGPWMAPTMAMAAPQHASMTSPVSPMYPGAGMGMGMGSMGHVGSMSPMMMGMDPGTAAAMMDPYGAAAMQQQAMMMQQAAMMQQQQDMAMAMGAMYGTGMQQQGHPGANAWQ